MNQKSTSVKEITSTTMLVVLLFGLMLGMFAGVWCASAPITTPHYMLTVSGGSHTEQHELIGHMEDCERVQTTVICMISSIASNIHITCSPAGEE